jgi:DNA-binding protein YbaB|tara:strand:+ start:140 stop:379 length:240 start_codon:yes stop_codon:yes gene_type:complete
MPKKLTAKQIAEMATGVRLSSHEKLCAERMKSLQEAIKELKTEVKSLRQDVSKGKGAISVLVFFGTIVTALVSYFTWDG